MGDSAGCWREVIDGRLPVVEPAAVMGYCNPSDTFVLVKEESGQGCLWGVMYGG